MGWKSWDVEWGQCVGNFRNRSFVLPSGTHKALGRGNGPDPNVSVGGFERCVLLMLELFTVTRFPTKKSFYC